MLSDFRFGTRFSVSDLDRARAFYVDTLGFQPSSEAAGHAFCFVFGDSSDVCIYAENDFACPDGIWEVEDVEAEVRALQARGIVFEEFDTPEHTSSNGIILSLKDTRRYAYFKDPEGHLLGIFPRAVH